MNASQFCETQISFMCMAWLRQKMQHIFFASNYYYVHTHDGIDKVPQATPWGKSDLFGYFYPVTNISVTKD